MSVSASHLYYTCPEGATARLVCNKRGAPLHHNDVLKQVWFFTPHKEQHCTGQKGPRNISLSHHSSQTGLHFGASQEDFWVELENVTHADEGRYCCSAFDFEQKHHYPVQRTHSHIILKVVPSKVIKSLGVVTVNK